jgi:cell division protein FtsI (penicillin-binding protein 3)
MFKDFLIRLSVMFGKSSGHYQANCKKQELIKVVIFIAKKLSYTEHMRLKKFPMFNKGANKGGLIIEQKIVREHPIGLVAKRTIGYERSNEDGKGLEYAFRDY